MGKRWFNLTTEETAKELDANLIQGLSSDEVVKRREKYGSNELKAKKKKAKQNTVLISYLSALKTILCLVSVPSKRSQSLT